MNLKGKKFFILPLMIFSSIILNSCDNSIGVPSFITVSGQVGFDFGFAENYKVEIGGQRAQTDINGRFVIGNILAPYEVKIINPSGTFVHIYQGVSLTEPNFNLGPAFSYPLSTTIATNVNIELPITPGSNQSIAVKFIPDSDEPDAYTEAAQNNNNEILTKVRWNQQTEINGKMMVLYYTKSGYRIISYDRLYYKQVTLQDDLPVIYSILPSDTYFSPVEANVSGNVSQTFNTDSDIDCELIFPGAREMNIFDHQPLDNTFNFVVPQSLPFNYKIRVRAYNGFGEEEQSLGIKDILPSTAGNIIEMHRPPMITSPSDNDSISFNNTLFQWTNGEGFGVYQLILLISENNNLKVVYLNTSSLSAGIPDLSSLGFTHTIGADCKVYIKKQYGFGTINSLVDDNMIDDPNYSGSSISIPVNTRLY